MYSNKFLESSIDSRNEIRCENNIYHMTNTCMYDDAFMLIKNGKKEYLLSKREDKFLNLLLKKRGIVTYCEMTQHLSTNYDVLTLNAIRLLVKDFRKKLPNNAIKNIQGVGYRLVL